jgi:hypothetical protein
MSNTGISNFMPINDLDPSSVDSWEEEISVLGDKAFFQGTYSE